MTLNLSQNAYAKLLSMMPPSQRLRIRTIAAGCSGLEFRMSWEDSVDTNPTDKIMHMSPLEIAVDARSALFLDGVILDHSDGLEGKGFEWINPKAKRVCGCGSSFSV